MDRLFACLVHNGGAAEKQAQYSCFILSNLVQVGEQALEVFRNYERVLLMVTCNDEQLSSVTAPILFALSGRGEQGRNANIAPMRLHMREEMEEDDMESSEEEEEEEEEEEMEEEEESSPPQEEQ